MKGRWMNLNKENWCPVSRKMRERPDKTPTGLHFTWLSADFSHDGLVLLWTAATREVEDGMMRIKVKFGNIWQHFCSQVYLFSSFGWKYVALNHLAIFETLDASSVEVSVVALSSQLLLFWTNSQFVFCKWSEWRVCHTCVYTHVGYILSELDCRAGHHLFSRLNKCRTGS